MINTKAFVLLAGDPSRWDEELRQRIKKHESLLQVQEDQHARGRRSAELVKGVFGFYVRAASNLDSLQVLARTKDRGGPLSGTRDNAVQWGKMWANEDPQNREFFARKNLLPLQNHYQGYTPK